MPRPSDPLLRWLRQLLKDRKLTAPAVAEKAGLDRNRTRQILAGHDGMTVDELLHLSKALQISPTDLGLAGVDAPADLPDVPLEEPEIPEVPGTRVLVDPLGNHPRALFEMGFALQCDFLFMASTAELDGAGVPQATLARYQNRELPIKLDAAYHAHNNPRYDDVAVQLTLSFDALYECRFPWTAIKQVVFYPAPPPPVVEEPPAEEPPPPTRGKPFLRLVE